MLVLLYFCYTDQLPGLCKLIIFNVLSLLIYLLYKVRANVKICFSNLKLKCVDYKSIFSYKLVDYRQTMLLNVGLGILL